MKFLIDMPLSPEMGTSLRSLDHDAVHASELSLSRAPDEMILARATDQKRVIVTADLDFSRLLARLASLGPGLILLRGETTAMRKALNASIACS